MENKKKCACCGFYTITEIKETCPVCFWEEDSFQEKNIDDNSGPNRISLRESRENYIKFGVKDIEYLDFVRKPNDDER